MVHHAEMTLIYFIFTIAILNAEFSRHTAVRILNTIHLEFSFI